MLIINNRFLSLYDYNFLLVIEKIRKRNSKICGSQILLLASRVILHVRDHIMVELGLSLNVLSFKPAQRPGEPHHLSNLLFLLSLSPSNFFDYILIQHILVFSFLLEKSIMDGVYVIFILVEHHLSFYLYFYILEELYFMFHTFIIQIFGFQEFFFSSS